MRRKPKYSVSDMVSLRGLWVIQMETPRITVDVWYLFEHPESGGHEKYTSALTEGWGQPLAKSSAYLSKNKLIVTVQIFLSWRSLMFLLGHGSYLYNSGVLLGKFLTLVQFCLISLNFCKQILGTKTSQNYHCYSHH